MAHGDVPQPGVHRPAAAPVPRHGGREQLGEGDPPRRLAVPGLPGADQPVRGADRRGRPAEPAQGLLRCRHLRAGPAAVGGRRGHHAAGVRRRAVGGHRHGDRRFRGAGHHGLATAWCCRCCCAGAATSPRASSRTWRGCCSPSAASPSSPSILLGYLFYRLLGQTHGLASIGLVSFAAIAQFAPAFFGGLVWRNATARGAIAGIVSGLRGVGLHAAAALDHRGRLGAALRPDRRPVRPRASCRRRRCSTCSSSRSRTACCGAWPPTCWCSSPCRCCRAPEPIERLQAQVFVPERLCRGRRCRPSFRLWRTSVTAGDLQHTVARYLGAERAERSFAEYAASRSAPISPDAEADIHLLRFTEHLLASAIGAASSRLVLSLLLRRRDAGSQSALRLLDDASEALQYNRDLLQSALDQVRHGLSVFDKDMRLICWNRQFRELLNLPPELGRVGAPLDRILRTCAERGDFGAGDIDKLVADRLMKLARGARDVPGAVRRRPAHPRDPHQPHAAGRHRHHLFRHHRARGGVRGAGARQRDARAPRPGAHGRADRGQRGAGGGQAQGRRGQPRQDALPGGGEPRRAAAAQRRAALRDEPGRAHGSAARRRRSPATSTLRWRRSRRSSAC